MLNSDSPASLVKLAPEVEVNVVDVQLRLIIQKLPAPYFFQWNNQ